MHWNEPSDPNSWGDNNLCAKAVGEFSAGGFTFSMAGPKAGKTCVNVNEPGDPDTWSDNFFCSDTDLGLRWSFAGPIAGMTCTNVTESADARQADWADNFLCVPTEQPWRFTWSSAGPIAGKTCVRWFEHSDTSATWLDNWMCVEERMLSVAPEAPPVQVEPIPEPGSPQPEGADPVSGMHLESKGCSAAPADLVLFAAAALLLRRRR